MNFSAFPRPGATPWPSASSSRAFICYLGTSQQIFAEQYGQGELFAVWFGVFAVAIAFAMIFNGRLVMRYGMRMLVQMGGAGLHRAFGPVPGRGA